MVVIIQFVSKLEKSVFVDLKVKNIWHKNHKWAISEVEAKVNFYGVSYDLNCNRNDRKVKEGNLSFYHLVELCLFSIEFVDYPVHLL